MSTSLAEQLKRLQRPQTSHFVDVRKKASILFDAKEAADKDREQIYDIGYSGLLELIQLNGDFEAFQRTLFDASSKDMVRAVETEDVNQSLNKQIRKFMHHLSPYFMLQPAFKALEWLIRRFSIEKYNQDDFLMLILPYHSTMRFVRCLQCMELDSKWSWLEGVKRTGTPLAKQTLFNHVGSDQSLIKFITKTVTQVVKSLPGRTHTLQTLFGFYCTTLLGALDSVPNISEQHFMNVVPGILKGLASPSPDFTAAALMLLQYILSKISLAADTLDLLTQKIIEINHKSQQGCAVLVMLMIFESQSHYKAMPQQSLDALIEARWFLAILGEVKNVKISALYVPVLSACLRRVQEKADNYMKYKHFVEALLNGIALDDPQDTANVVRCALNSYILKEKLAADDVITIDSDDDCDEIPLSDSNLDVSQWYSTYLRSLERQYPDVMAKVMKQVLAVNNSSMSAQRKAALKAVLGFLLIGDMTKSGTTEGDTLLFENLFHHQAKCRVEAMRQVVANFDELQSASENTQRLIKSSIQERFADDDPRVIAEVLRLSTDRLIDQLGEGEFLGRAFDLLNKPVRKQSELWSKIKLATLKHVTGNVDRWQEISKSDLFVSLFPLLLAEQEHETCLAEHLARSALARDWAILGRIVAQCKGEDSDGRNQAIEKELESAPEVVPLHDLIGYCERMRYQKQNHLQVYFALRMMRLPEGVDVVVARKVLSILSRFIQTKVLHEKTAVTEAAVPVNLVTKLMSDIIEKVTVKNTHPCHFTASNSVSVAYLGQTMELLIRNVFRPEMATDRVFGTILKQFFGKYFASNENIIEFLSNYYSGHRIQSRPMDAKLQMMAICTTNAWLAQQTAAGDSDWTISDVAVLKMLVGLNHDAPAMKQQVFETLRKLAAFETDHQRLFQFVVKHHEEIMMDSDQIAFVLFNFMEQKATARGKSAKASNASIVDRFVDVIVDIRTPNYVKANALILMRHINSSAVLNKLSACVSDIFGSTSKVEAKFRYLSRDEMTIIEEVVLRLNQSTVKDLRKNANVWTAVFAKILENADFIYKPNENTVESPFVKLMEVIDEAMFAQLPLQYQKALIEGVLKVNNCGTDNHSVFWAVSKLFKTVPLDGEIIVDALVAMRDVVTVVSAPSSAKSRRGKRRPECTPDILLTLEWRCGNSLLEFIQHKKDIKNASQMLPVLFEVLKRCTDFEIQNPVEYSKQMLLATILQCFKHLTSPQEMKQVLSDPRCLQVDLVVNCIRGSHNPQTHHHALQLICHLAPLVPDLVLQNITDIFTFMGSSIVRQDDAYSLQIIGRIIETVVPILMEKSGSEAEKMVAVLKIFTDIILDVPEHRRQVMYVKLFTVLEASEYLWIFVAIILATHVMGSETEAAKSQQKTAPSSSSQPSGDDLPKRIRVALSIATEFEPSAVVETCCKLVDYMQSLPTDRGNNDEPTAAAAAAAKKKTAAKRTTIALENAIFNAQTCTNRQLRHMRYSIAQFVSTATASVEFVNRVKAAAASSEAQQAIKPFYQKFIIADLMCVASLAEVVDDYAHSVAHQKYWRIILNHCYESLHNIVLLLTNNLFVAVVKGLLEHKFVAVRKKILELLISKLQLRNEFVSQCDEVALLELLQPLGQIIGSIKVDEKAQTKVNNDVLMVQQMALIAVKLLAKLLASSHPDLFLGIYQNLIDQLQHDRHNIPVVVLSSQVLCIAELSVTVGPVAIRQLPTVLPIYLEILRTQTHSTTIDTVLVAMLSALQKTIETFALFMGAHLEEILYLLSLVTVKLTKGDRETGKMNATLSKINAIGDRIAKQFPLRMLVPAIETAHGRLLEDGGSKLNVDAIGPLMSILSKSFADVSSNEIQNVHQELSDFFLNALEFRTKYSAQLPIADLNSIEDGIITTLISLILKLSETTFKPLYYKIYDWAIRQAEDDKRDRTITFYRLSSKIVESLKSLFVLFAIDFVQNSTSLLDACHASKADALWFPGDEAKCSVLLDGIIRMYSNIFSYGCNQFMNADRFELLCVPLVDQLENPLVLKDERLLGLVSKTIAEMGGAIDDSLWRQLNHAVLLKTRHKEGEVRLCSLRTCVAFARLIGEEYQSLLPETIPFISELLEDENADVERGCQECIKELETILNDTIQKYL